MSFDGHGRRKQEVAFPLDIQRVPIEKLGAVHIDQRTAVPPACPSAANVKVYGGGVAEEGFLRALLDLIGYSYANDSVR